LADNFSVDVQQNDTEEQLLFGGFTQQDYFKLDNRNVVINSSFLFSNDVTGVLDPANDLLFNVSAWAYQGSNVSIKVSLSAVSSTSLTYNELLPFQSINLSSNYSIYKFYLVNDTQNVEIYPSSVNTSTGVINYPSVSVPSNCWLEVFQYGNVSALTAFPIVYEPMFRIDTSEGSFYPCMVDKISFSVGEDYVKLNCTFVSINYDRSTRFNFINTTSVAQVIPAIKPLHKSRIKISDYVNDITTNFLIADLKNLDYTNALLTQSVSASPFKEFSINIDNSLRPYYSNRHSSVKNSTGMQRTYVTGYYSQKRKIEGSLTALALRSSQPTFEKYPALTSQSNKSLNFYFGNQTFQIPYTIWKPGKIELTQENYALVKFDWQAITRDRQGQPIFQME
jgi:hypothetical protein